MAAMEIHLLRLGSNFSHDLMLDPFEPPMAYICSFKTQHPKLSLGSCMEGRSTHLPYFGSYISHVLNGFSPLKPPERENEEVRKSYD